MDKKIVLITAHPALEKSRNNKKMIAAARAMADMNVQVRDLYELYPKFDVHVKREQSLLEAADVILLQHPFYWYSIPALMKQYLDTVFSYGWAYGKKSGVLKDKCFLNVITTNGTRESYRTGGHNRFDLAAFLVPFSQLAYVCKMHYLPPFVLFESGKISELQSQQHAGRFSRFLQILAGTQWDVPQLQQLELINDLPALKEN